MARSPTTEKVIPYALLGMTAVSGLVDAVSFLSLGHVFTVNMTGNVVFLAFAIAGVPKLSIARSSCALGAFLVGALVGGRTMADRDADSQLRWTLFAFVLELALLSIATVISIGYRGPEVSRSNYNSAHSHGNRIGSRFFACGRKESAMAKESRIGNCDVCWSRFGSSVDPKFFSTRPRSFCCGGICLRPRSNPFRSRSLHLACGEVISFEIRGHTANRHLWSIDWDPGWLRECGR
jgi:Protein of unknown function (DUF1275)